MKTLRFAASSALVVLFAGCGSDEASNDSATTVTSENVTTDQSTTTSVAVDTTASTTASTAPATSSTAAASTTTTAVTLEQLAIWPSADVVFNDPTDAAIDFVSKVLNVPAELGEFRQGDSRSGEIDVLSPGEGAGPAVVRSTLLLRQLGPENGWFLLAAVNENITIESPEALATIAFGPTEVSGEGRGFEATLIVEAFRAGDAVSLSENVVQGGSGAEPEPYSALVVLQGTENGGRLDSGDTVLLLVRGGVGLETDPGEFTAIAVTIG